MVAFAAGGLLLAAVGGFLYMAGRPARRAQAKMANTAALSMLEKRLQRDLSMARGRPVLDPATGALRFPVHPDGEWVEYRFAEGTGLVRTQGTEAPKRLALNAAMRVDFQVTASSDTTSIAVRATALRDTRTVEADGTHDSRPDAELTVTLPNHVFDGGAAFGGMWQSPEPSP